MGYTTDGDTVNTKNAFFARRSCAEIKAKFAAASTGFYYITTFVSTKKTFDRVKVWCDMASQKTFLPITKGKRVIPYNNAAGHAGSCADYGMRMPAASYISAAAKVHFAAEYFPKKGETSNEYLCTIRLPTPSLESTSLSSTPRTRLATRNARPPSAPSSLEIPSPRSSSSPWARSSSSPRLARRASTVSSTTPSKCFEVNVYPVPSCCYQILLTIIDYYC